MYNLRSLIKHRINRLLNGAIIGRCYIVKHTIENLQRLVGTEYLP